MASGNHGIGHLTGAGDSAHSMSWIYDGLGRVIGKSITNNTITKAVGYGYTNGDRTSLVTPSGQTVVYGYANHRINSITINGTTLMSNVLYEAFGPAKSWTWGDGVTETRNYNTDGNISTIVNSETITLGYDNALRVNSNADNYGTGYSWTLGYDNDDRLNSATEVGATYGWTFDGNGNQLTQTGTLNTTFNIATTSNQITSTTGSLGRTYSYNGKGDVAGYGTTSYTYNDRDRIKTAVAGGVTSTYWYNALGEMFQKRVGSTYTFLVYDEDHHLIGEYTSSGSLIQETIWMDDTPVATIRPNGSSVTVYFVQTDQLGTPRMVARTTDHKPVWRWDPDPYGAVQPNQNPYGIGTFVYNLRFPGQYYQAETGLNYNYFRDYDPATGRYLESDPIGLHGGSFSTYAYAGGNPIGGADPSGLIVRFDDNPVGNPYIAQLIAAYSEIQNSSAGAALINALESSPVVYTITDQPDPINGSRADFNQYTNTVHLDPTFHSVIAVSPPCYSEASPTVANLAHELGHAAQSAFLGANTPFNENDNVNQYENPIRAQLGLPVRTAYPPIKAFKFPAPRPLLPPLTVEHSNQSNCGCAQH